jgi:hypothetical protein
VTRARRAACLLHAALLPGALAVAGCARDQAFPDLLPRPHEAPRQVEETASASAGLSDAERAALRDELARARATRDSVRRAAAAAGQALDPALARARGAPAGSDAWADAQLLLSRLDQARAGYGEIEAALAPLVRLVDPAPPDDPDRLQLEAFLATIRAEADAIAERQERAARQLR